MFVIGRGCKIHETAIINVKHGHLGHRSIVGPNARIEGNDITIGTESFIDADAWIGGGSCFDKQATLVIGDWLHMGRWSHINLARETNIGHEFGCGMATRVFSHGSYLSAWDGFPTQWESVVIGDRVWLPHAWVNPGVRIGSNVVVAAMSLVNKDLPSGCLAGGTPIKILKENVYPRKLNSRERFAKWQDIFSQTISATGIVGRGWELISDGSVKVNDTTVFNLDERTIQGEATAFTEALKEQLRRNGIRFRYIARDGAYIPWQKY